MSSRTVTEKLKFVNHWWLGFFSSNGKIQISAQNFRNFEKLYFGTSAIFEINIKTKNNHFTKHTHQQKLFAMFFEPFMEANSFNKFNGFTKLYK